MALINWFYLTAAAVGCLFPRAGFVVLLVTIGLQLTFGDGDE